MALLNEHNETALPGIFEMYCVGSRTARLTVNYPDGEGVFFFEKGELIEAQLGELNGMEAVDRALRLQEEGFRVDLDVAVPPRTIFGEWGGLLDEDNRRQNGDHNHRPSTDEAAIDPMMSDEQQTEGEGRDDEVALNGNVTPIISGKSAGSEITTRPAAEATMKSSANQRTRPTVVPDPARVEAADDEQSVAQSILAATGIVQSGIIIDEDGVIAGEIGEADEALAQTAFMVTGLESLVSAQFDLGSCEGAVLDKDGTAMLVTVAAGLSCIFVPTPRLPIARAFNETRRALEAMAGERE
ncbi:MAG TPA: DUF4388 domain-containing protein [Blastocatellia bacterium]|nr:DUF4388 domain-containing protein [Blastocatellia bacterium]